MTVQELLDNMIGAYPKFDSGALSAMAPVFQRKLERYEGPELANAWIEVAAAFRPTGAKPYPAPADFEEVLPRAVRMPKGSAGLDLKGHAERKAKLVDGWRQSQGSEIAGLWGSRVRFWCDSEVRERADRLAWDAEVESVALSGKDIEATCQRIASSDRVGTFGPTVLERDGSYDAWREQIDHCRTHVLAGRFTYDETPQAVRMQRPKKSGPVFDVPAVEVGEPPAWLDDGAPERDGVPESE